MDSSALLINYNWHHAVNDQSKLDHALALIQDGGSSRSNDSGASDGAVMVEAIEADIIYSQAKLQAVMGHPPMLDGELTLVSFLEQISRANFQPRLCGGSMQEELPTTTTERPVLKLDFKSMTALQSSLPHVKNYLTQVPPSIEEKVWINADILPGPGAGEDLADEEAQKKVQPQFNAKEFLELVTSQLPGTTLSIGWVTSLTSIHAPYTESMVNDMIECCRSYPNVTFPIRGSCFKQSWGVLQKLYNSNKKWTLTLWWSKELSTDEFDVIYYTLEQDGRYRNRTYYDLSGFHQYLVEQGVDVTSEIDVLKEENDVEIPP